MLEYTLCEFLFPIMLNNITHNEKLSRDFNKIMNKSINEIITHIRKEHKLSRKALEELSGFKARTIESYERGQNPPSKEYIEFISLYFGYKKEYIEGKIDDRSDIYLNKGKQTLKIYQSIFNYDNQKMSELLEISIEEYISLLERMDGACFDIVINISKKLNIKFNCLTKTKLIDEIQTSIRHDEKFYRNRNDYQGLIDDIKEDLDKKDIIDLLNKKGLNITPEYYVSIIKQRNNPDIITPNTKKESIPDKYKDIVELLPFAPDNFLENLKNKLLELKRIQQFEDQ